MRAKNTDKTNHLLEFLVLLFRVYRLSTHDIMLPAVATESCPVPTLFGGSALGERLAVTEARDRRPRGVPQRLR